MTTITVPSGKKKSKAARRAARAAVEIGGETRPRVASRDRCMRDRGSVRCLAARESTTQAIARPFWT